MFVSPSRYRLRQLLAQTQRQNGDSAQGLTLIECLVAVFVIGLTVALITPPIFIATATRAQNRRAEQAMQIAQGEIDRIRVLVARSAHTLDRLPNVANAAPLQSVPPPNGFVSGLLKSSSTQWNTYDDQAIAIDKGLQVDVDGDREPDFFMQVFRTRGSISADQTQRNVSTPNQIKPTDFQVGVRVYSILADGSRVGNSWSDLQTQPASLQMTNGEGSQRQRPLAVVYSPFSWSDQSSTLCDYFQDQNPNALSGSCTPR